MMEANTEITKLKKAPEKPKKITQLSDSEKRAPFFPPTPPKHKKTDASKICHREILVDWRLVADPAASCYTRTSSGFIIGSHLYPLSFPNWLAASALDGGFFVFLQALQWPPT